MQHVEKKAPPAPLFTDVGWLSRGRARAPALYWEWFNSSPVVQVVPSGGRRAPVPHSHFVGFPFFKSRLSPAISTNVHFHMLFPIQTLDVQTFDHTSIMPLWTNHLGMLTGHNFGQMQEFLLSPMWCHIITHYFSTNTTNPPELLWSSNWEIGNLCREMIMATTPGFCRLIERSRPPPSLSSPPLFGRFLAVIFTIFSGNCFTALYSLNLETLQM